jgi:hypothetical protein
MQLTVLDQAEMTSEADIDEDHVWIPAADLEPATGWTRKPEGLCRQATCVPVRTPVDGPDGTIDLAAVARALGKRLVVDAGAGVAAIADDPMGRGEPRNLHELCLPDVDGRMVDLSGTAGKKVVLLAWASW